MPRTVRAALSRWIGRLLTWLNRHGLASEEELLGIVDAATEGEAAEHDPEESHSRFELIHSVFEFSDTVVREVMVPRTDMVTVAVDDTVSEAMGVFLGRGVSRVPVIAGDADDVTGVLYLRDAARLVFERPGSADTTPVQALQRPAVFVPESMDAADLLRQMQRESNHIALVVDEYGGTAGLVTMEDLIEELVGEISDEYDRSTPDVEPIGEDAYRVAARFNVEELGDLFGIELEDEDVDSVGGLLAKALGKIPAAGDSASVGGLTLTAERTEGGRRGRVRTVIVRREEEATDE